MPFSYTSRRGDTYYLHRVTRKNGKTAYAMKRKLGEGALNELPEGYEISESVNGAVSVRRPPKRIITEAEEGLVREALERHDRGQYRREIKGRRIVFLEPRRDAIEMCADYSRFTGLPAEVFRRRVEERLERTQRYDPVLRFTLQDTVARTFDVERMTYRGAGGWRTVTWALPLDEALREYVRHLGRESFFAMEMPWFEEDRP